MDTCLCKKRTVIKVRCKLEIGDIVFLIRYGWLCCVGACAASMHLQKANRTPMSSTRPLRTWGQHDSCNSIIFPTSLFMFAMCFVNFMTPASWPRQANEKGAVRRQTAVRLAFRASGNARISCLNKAAPQVMQSMHDATDGRLGVYVYITTVAEAHDGRSSRENQANRYSSCHTE